MTETDPKLLKVGSEVTGGSRALLSAACYLDASPMVLGVYVLVCFESWYKDMVSKGGCMGPSGLFLRRSLSSCLGKLLIVHF